MNSSKDNSSMRYLMASLKPFGSPLFWGPLGLLALGLLGFWQYQQHPEWLNTEVEQPEQSINSNPIATNDYQTQINPNTSTENPDSEFTQELDPTEILTLSEEKTKKRSKFDPTDNNELPVNTENNQSSLFMPLLPTIKQNTQTDNNNQDNDSIQVTPVPVTQYPLQKAIESAPNYQYNSNNSSGYNGNGYNSNNRVTNVPNPYNSQPQGYQSPYSNYYGGQNNTANPYGQNYQTYQPPSTGYSPYSNNYYGQNSQTYQSPYNNNYNQQNQQNQQNQGNSNNFNNNSGQNYQVQPQIDADPIGY